MRVCVCVCVYTYIMDIAQPEKKNEIVPLAATWIDLEMIILSQTENDKYHMIWLMCGI